MEKLNEIENFKNKKAFICDMDGVIYHGNQLLPGVKEFVNWLIDNKKEYLFLTNSSQRSPKELAQKLERLGLDVPEKNFYTSALATATFLASQKPHCTAYVIGDAGLTNALYDQGIAMNDINPDYVVVGETQNYTLDRIEQATELLTNGAKLIGTNYDLTGPTERGIMPATRALIAPIELTTGKLAYYVGKPNPLMMRNALKKIGCSPEETVIIGDRMDTDIIAGIESEIDTILVLSGVTDRVNINNYPYSPQLILDGVGELII